MNKVLKLGFIIFFTFIIFFKSVAQALCLDLHFDVAQSSGAFFPMGKDFS